MRISLQGLLFSLSLFSMRAFSQQACQMEIELMHGRLTLDEKLMRDLTKVSSYATQTRSIQIRNCDFSLYGGLLQRLSVFSILTDLEILNSTLNLEFVQSYKYTPLKRVRLKRNNISTFNLRLAPNLIDLDLSSNSLLRVTIGPGSHLFLRSVNVSDNNLVDFNILTRLRDLQSLDLSKNRLRDLDFARSVTANTTSLQLDVSRNELQCSPAITADWLILKSADALLTEDVTCSFPNSSNTYLISEHGLHFTNESDIFQSLWLNLLLQAHLEFGSVRFFVDVFPDRTKIRWTAMKQMHTSYYLVYRSSAGIEMQSETVDMTQGERTIPATSGIVEVCFDKIILRPSEGGPVDTNETMRCSPIPNSMARNAYKYAFLATLIVGTLYVLVSLLVCTSLCRRLQKMPQSSLEVISMVDLTNNSITQSRQTIVTNDIYVEAAEGADDRVPAKSEKEKSENCGTYLPMDSTEMGVAETNIYEGMEFYQVSESLTGMYRARRDADDIYDTC